MGELITAPAMKSPKSKSSSNKSGQTVWKFITFLLIGLLAGYLIGRFELTTIAFKTSFISSPGTAIVQQAQPAQQFIAHLDNQLAANNI